MTGNIQEHVLSAPGGIVTIVGRPNVGKSAVFNRLAGRRIAIVHSQSGVTRDRLMREISWRGVRFDLIDTGGISMSDGKPESDAILRGVRDQVNAALADAACCLLVVDIAAGLTPLDSEISGMLHRRGCKAVILANKADSPRLDAGSADFEGLGFPVFPVSALHDRGFDPAMKRVVASLPERDVGIPVKPLKVAIVGRPNVGKSSYINRLLRSERVIVSDVPGTTRDSIDIPFVVGAGPYARHYLLIDTAGIRRVAKTKTSVDRFGLFRSEQSIENTDVAVLVLDATAGCTAQDKRIAAKIRENGKGCVVLVNKWDLMGQASERKYVDEILGSMPFMSYCPVICISAGTGYNIRRTVDIIDHVGSRTVFRLPGGILNRCIADAVARTAPPAMKGKRLKIYYAVQTGAGPVTIRLFVNDVSTARTHYGEYLAKEIRRKFGLDGAPVRIDFRSKHSGTARGAPHGSIPQKRQSRRFQKKRTKKLI